MTSPELHARLLDDARSYNSEAHHRSLFEPFRDVILLQRAKFMSYEQIAGAFTRNGIRVSGPGVASYCRRTFTRAEIDRMRQQLRTEARQTLAEKPPTGSPTASTGIKPGGPTPPGKRGPKIARDNY